MKLYITGPESRGEGVYTIISEEGEPLASHFCSHAGYAEGDLEGDREERQVKWKKRFGEYEVLDIGQDDLTMKVLLERNKKWYEENKTEKE